MLPQISRITTNLSLSDTPQVLTGKQHPSGLEEAQQCMMKHVLSPCSWVWMRIDYAVYGYWFLVKAS